MAAEASTATNGASKSLAAMLEEQHARDEAHKPTVEDVVDEEDLKHPPLSATASDQLLPPILSPASGSVTPAETPAPTPAPKPAPKKAPAFDVKSEELFPALGSGPKPVAPAAATWGAKKSSAAAAVTNGRPSQPMGT
jgi:hypothetical protein